MMLLLLLLVLFCSGLFSLMCSPKNPLVPKAIATLGLSASIIIMAYLSANRALEFKTPWILTWGINFHLGLNDFSWWLILLTLIMGLIASFYETPIFKASSHFAAICWIIFGVVGLFLASDIFLFFVFWELSLLPVYWILILHGNKQNLTAAFRYIIFTQISGLFLLVAVIGLAAINFKTTGIFTFDYDELVKNQIPLHAQYYLFATFLVAFLIKLPAFPFHTWMPSLFSQAPVSIILVGVLVKTAIFGLLKFSWLLFPKACEDFSSPLMILGVITLVYGALLAFAQHDLKRLLAYGTFSHAGMLLIGVFCNNQPSYFGIVVLLITQALSTAGLLMLIHNLPVHDLKSNKGLWHKNPYYSSLLLMFLLAGFGFPLFGNFIGEWLMLVGIFSYSPWISFCTALGLVLGVIYSLRLFQKLCWGDSEIIVPSIPHQQKIIYGLMIATLVIIGLNPGFIMSSLKFESAQKVELP